MSVVNDTVATLLAAKAAYPDNASSYIGFILGTGTNTAYAEENGNISKIGGKGDGRQIVNVESGCLALSLGDIDREFIDSTKDPGSYWFEKMISGAYLGLFSAKVIEKAIEEGVLSDAFADRYHLIDKLNTTLSKIINEDLTRDLEKEKSHYKNSINYLINESKGNLARETVFLLYSDKLFNINNDIDSITERDIKNYIQTYLLNQKPVVIIAKNEVENDNKEL